MTGKITAPLASLIIASILSGTAAANDLAKIRAVACGTDPAKASSVSMPTGALFERGRLSALAQNKDGDFPGMVKLKMVYQHDGYAEMEHCGGTVIDSRHIVTAAHCVKAKDGAQWDRIEVMTGDSSLASEKVIRRTTHTAICHAGADNFLANDIAIIKLQQPLPKEVIPATIDEYRRPSITEGAIALAAGWPVTGDRAGETDLKKVPLAVTDVEWPGFITVTSPSGRMEGVCQGESGGPLLSTTNGVPSIVGVLSGIQQGTNNASGEPCMMAGYDMYYTPIAAYRDWIDAVVDLCSHDPDACRGKQESSFFMSSAPAQAHRMASYAR